MVKKKKS
jgi:hypothetical protein